MPVTVKEEYKQAGLMPRTSEGYLPERYRRTLFYVEGLKRREGGVFDMLITAMTTGCQFNVMRSDFDFVDHV